MIWVVRGDTYEHRGRLKKFGWRWDPDAKWWWISEAEGDANPNKLAQARDLDGVVVELTDPARAVDDEADEDLMV